MAPGLCQARPEAFPPEFDGALKRSALLPSVEFVAVYAESASKSVQEDHMSAQEFTAMVLKNKLNIARGL